MPPEDKGKKPPADPTMELDVGIAPGADGVLSTRPSTRPPARSSVPPARAASSRPPPPRSSFPPPPRRSSRPPPPRQLDDPQETEKLATPPRFSRRRLFRIGLGSAALLGLGGFLAWHTTGYRLPAVVERRLRALTPKEYLIVSAMADRILRSDDDAFPSLDELDVLPFIDGLVAELDPAVRDDLKKLLHVVEHAMPISTGRPDWFTRLSGESQDAVLRAMTESGVGAMRGGFEAIKSLCVMAYFRDPRTWPAIGYDGPLVNRPAAGWGRG